MFNQCSCVCVMSQKTQQAEGLRAKMPRIPRASPEAACNYAFQPSSELCCFPCLSSTSTLTAACPPWLCATMPSSSPTCLRGTSFIHNFGPRQGLRRPCPRSHDLGYLQKVTLSPFIALQLIVHKHTVQCRRTLPQFQNTIQTWFSAT